MLEKGFRIDLKSLLKPSHVYFYCHVNFIFRS